MHNAADLQDIGNIIQHIADIELKNQALHILVIQEFFHFKSQPPEGQIKYSKERTD